MAGSTRSLKVAIFHFGFFYSGGGEKLVLEEMRGLRLLGHDVTCFSPYVDREVCFPGISEMREIRTLLPPPPRWLPFRHALWVILCCLAIPLMAGRFRSFDVFFAANQPAPWFAFVLGKLLGKPYVIYLAQPLRLLHPRRIDVEEGLRITDGDQRFVQFLTRIAGWLIDRADKISVRNAAIVLTNGEHVSRWIREVYGIQDEVCPAGCHPIDRAGLSLAGRWCGTVQVNGFRIPKPYVLLTNRHAPQKRFEYALWALKTIQGQAPDLSMVITGQETGYTKELRYLVDGLRLGDKVRFVGLVSEEALASLYKEAALYVYPAPEEDFGMGIVEAMAAGTPVVAWNNGGPKQTVLDGETGFLVAPNDVNRFAERMLALGTDRGLGERMGIAAHRRAVDLFGYAAHNAHLESTLVRAVAANEGRRDLRQYGTHQARTRAVDGPRAAGDGSLAPTETACLPQAGAPTEASPG